jgi:GAF domain-containing protein
MSIKPPVPANEKARLAALQHYRILDTAPERSFDAITELASFICEAPIAFVSLVDRERQWFKSKIGLEATETHRDSSFCAHVVFKGALMVVEDATKDARFTDNPLVTDDPHIRFYAGAPLITPDGHGLGSLCVVDRAPRKLSSERASALEKLAALVVAQLELRRVSHELAEVAKNVKTLSGLVPICSHCKAIRNDKDYWETVEAFVKAHSDAEFSHGICPDCARKHYPELFEELEDNRRKRDDAD